ncbi:hypothetical protein [Streptacidiphilus albus]|uniref:hypothetical protein n=1 Tax=Streptacidiphilus albus TaxID=105425 RepID=UPI00128B8E4A|nr:hypothetical protein [Streptacidiphilus albus]
MKITFDSSALTLGDMVDFKAKAGATVADAFAPRNKIDPFTGEVVKDGRGRPVRDRQVDPLHLVTLVWLLARKDNPAFTFEDAMNVPVAELDVTGEDETDPKGKTN